MNVEIIMEDGTSWAACEKALVTRLDEGDAHDKWTRPGLFLVLANCRMRKGMKRHLVVQTQKERKDEVFAGEVLILKRGDESVRLEGAVVVRRLRDEVMLSFHKWEAIE